MKQRIFASKTNLFLAVMSVAVAAHSQALPPSQNVFMRTDGHCAQARPGDTVHYALTIQGLENAPTVYADLQMHTGRLLPFRRSGLPAPDLHSMGGGGLAKADAVAGMYEFSFVVPQEIYGGIYRGVSVTVSTSLPLPVSAPPSFVDVSRRTQKQVHSFCLNVVTQYGALGAKPEVTGFQAGQVVPK